MWVSIWLDKGDAGETGKTIAISLQQHLMDNFVLKHTRYQPGGNCLGELVKDTFKVMQTPDLLALIEYVDPSDGIVRTSRDLTLIPV